MLLSIIFSFSALAVICNMIVLLQSSNNTPYNNLALPNLKPRDDNDYDCSGSIMCPTLKVQACDVAINTFLIRDDNLTYGATGSGKPHKGVCHGIGTDFGCAIFVQGRANCTRSGNDMWWDYQEIRDHHCHHCGHKHWSSGCTTTIDYKPQCDLVQ
ncbi:uncharacterized protein F4822DRAFT_425340 [Hypoxylon trugodes]|uniref:uncharacterized protein n=1 Tax=Hypoxylon trugodes TaxID=326681 RepID=UPI0021992DEA|nr:uncharacterized protein F4822DRAFT_425340 [Hypoxylon trugodes]KAI1392124.1 hypothetical protein F4822DRAFT_425340 [Hypoxylon trugodes]